MCRALADGGRRCTGSNHTGRFTPTPAPIRRTASPVLGAAAHPSGDVDVAVPKLARTERPPTPAPRLTPPAPDRPLTARIDDVYSNLVAVPGDWASLTRLRAALPGVARTELDAELMRRLDAEEIVLAPEADQQRLTPTDRANAIRVGGRDCHLLVVHDSEGWS